MSFCLLLLWTSSVMGLSSQVLSNPPRRVPKASCLLSILSFSSVLLVLSVKKGHGASHFSPYSRTRENTLLSKLGLDNCPVAPCGTLRSALQDSFWGPGTVGAAGRASAFAGPCDALVSFSLREKPVLLLALG